MKALLSNYRQAPRKVRLLADLARGQSVTVAVTRLNFSGKRAAKPMVKLIESATANAIAKNPALTKEELWVGQIRVDGGAVLKRYKPRARGRAAPIHKHSSRIFVRLERKTQNAK